LFLKLLKIVYFFDYFDIFNHICIQYLHIWYNTIIHKYLSIQSKKLSLQYVMTNLTYLLSKNIKKRRKELSFSQAVLAEKVDVTTHYIAQIEQQNNFPSLEVLERIAVALEIDSPELFSAGPFPEEAIQQFQEGVKADIDKRIERLIKSKSK